MVRFSFVVESEIQVNLTVVENSTVVLPFLITPSGSNASDSHRLTWWKTVRLQHNVVTRFMEDIPRTKWYGEFRRNSNKASLDTETGSLTIHSAQLSDTDRYFYDLNPKKDNVMTNVTINLKVVSKYKFMFCHAWFALCLVRSQHETVIKHSDQGPDDYLSFSKSRMTSCVSLMYLNPGNSGYYLGTSRLEVLHRSDSLRKLDKLPCYSCVLYCW